MKIGGLQKTSFVDFPGKVAATVFTQGCNFRCHFCHNRSLVDPQFFEELIDEKEFFDFLEKRRKILDAVVITGGEPTLQKDLISFIKKIKKLKYLVKLDTSGTNPNILKELLDEGLIDFVAMDIKAPIDKYADIVGVTVNKENILKSIKLIINSNVDHEFRTTLIKDYHSLSDIIKMAELICGAKRYTLQKFVSKNVLNPKFKSKKPVKEEDIELLKKVLQKHVKKVVYR